MEENKELTTRIQGGLELTTNSDSPIAMFQLAASQGMDLEKLDKMLELQEKWEKRESRKAYINAMAAFKANPPILFKQSKVSYGTTKYDYASLDHVAGEINKALSDYGMFSSWTQDQVEGKIKVTCRISHKDGHYEETSLFSNADTSGGKNAIQAIGSAITYLQRYTLLALTGLAAQGMDTDGNYSDKKGMQRNAPVELEADVPVEVVDLRPEGTKTESWEEFIARKNLSDAEIKEFDDYITESAISLGMESLALKIGAVRAGDLDDMLEAVMAGKKDEPANEPAKTNWWDSTKHWSFRSNHVLKDLICFGFGGKVGDSKACEDNPDAYNTLRDALPETKKALVKKFDKMFGAGEFNKLIEK